MTSHPSPPQPRPLPPHLAASEAPPAFPTAQKGWTALHYMAANGHLECVRALLDKGCDANAKDEVRRPPATAPGPRLPPSEPHVLMPSSTTQGGFTALHLSVLKGHLGCVKALLDNGCEVNAKNKVPCPPRLLSRSPPPRPRTCLPPLTPLPLRFADGQHCAPHCDREKRPGVRQGAVGQVLRCKCQE